MNELGMALQAAQLLAIVGGGAVLLVRIGRVLERIDNHERRITKIEDKKR